MPNRFVPPRTVLRIGYCECVRQVESPGISDAQVDRGRIAGPLLVPIDRAVPLRAEPAVHLQFAPVVLPGHAEHDDALPTNNPLDDLRLPVLRMLIQGGRAPLSKTQKANREFYRNLSGRRRLDILVQLSKHEPHFRFERVYRNYYIRPNNDI